ncbi:unnamed protein product [Hermetia illucens]|uniref:Uncharacterized protein n=1 Tax=Hermetia illucens TaxID=343691 RepID=A0A7R8UDU4_HERIL|nr:unnamed protein product [Hermetia illucens]
MKCLCNAKHETHACPQLIGEDCKRCKHSNCSCSLANTLTLRKHCIGYHTATVCIGANKFAKAVGSAFAEDRGTVFRVKTSVGKNNSALRSLSVRLYERHWRYRCQKNRNFCLRRTPHLLRLANSV